MHHPIQVHRAFSGRNALRLASASCAFALLGCASTPSGSMGSSNGSGTVDGSSSAQSGSNLGNGGAAAMLAAWPAKQRESGMMLVAKYGAPNVAGDQVMIWYNKGPYKKIELARTEVMHNFPMPHPDYLTATVMHTVPTDKVDDLAQYDGSVWFHRTRGELSAQCDKEEANNLALNLAHEIATGRRTVADARAFYAKTAMALMAGDKSSPYLSGIMFQQEPNAADADMAMKM